MTPEEMYKLNKSMSCQEIADKAGMTKNQVVGHIYRYRVANDLPPAKPKTLIKPKRKKLTRKKKTIIQVIVEPKPLSEINNGECRYPVSDDPYMFCGFKTDRMYCEYHHKLCHQNRTAKEQDRINKKRKETLEKRYGK